MQCRFNKAKAHVLRGIIYIFYIIDPGDLTEEVLKAKQLEKEAISMADKGRVKDAVATFGNAIHLAPHLPSLYNNRAQAHRLLGDTHSKLNIRRSPKSSKESKDRRNLLDVQIWCFRCTGRSQHGHYLKQRRRPFSLPGILSARSHTTQKWRRRKGSGWFQNGRPPGKSFCENGSGSIQSICSSL